MRIIFVCTGNTCRSPMAESIAKHLLPEHQIESRSLFAVPQQTISKHAQTILEKHHLELPTNAQPFTKDDLTADLILTMTQEHLGLLIQSFGSYPQMDTLSHFVQETGDIKDPYGLSLDVYEETYQQLARKINKIVKDKLV